MAGSLTLTQEGLDMSSLTVYLLTLTDRDGESCSYRIAAPTMWGALGAVQRDFKKNGDFYGHCAAHTIGLTVDELLRGEYKSGEVLDYCTARPIHGGFSNLKEGAE